MKLKTQDFSRSTCFCTELQKIMKRQQANKGDKKIPVRQKESRDEVRLCGGQHVTYWCKIGHCYLHFAVWYGIPYKNLLRSTFHWCLRHALALSGINIIFFVRKYCKLFWTIWSACVFWASPSILISWRQSSPLFSILISSAVILLFICIILG